MPQHFEQAIWRNSGSTFNHNNCSTWTENSTRQLKQPHVNLTLTKINWKTFKKKTMWQKSIWVSAGQSRQQENQWCKRTIIHGLVKTSECFSTILEQHFIKQRSKKQMNGQTSAASASLLHYHFANDSLFVRHQLIVSQSACNFTLFRCLEVKHLSVRRFIIWVLLLPKIL